MNNSLSTPKERNYDCILTGKNSNAMNKLLASLILLFSSTVHAQTTLDSLRSELEQVIKDGPLIGLGVAIITKDSILFKDGFGYANREQKVPYTTDLLQPIGSISKTLLGVSLLKAQELNMLKLDDPINQYLPFEIEHPYSAKPITIRHLASHTAGIRDTKHYEKAYLFAKPIPLTSQPSLNKLITAYNDNEPIPLKDYLHRIYHYEGSWFKNRNFLKADPGDKYEYSNNGAAIASLIIASASGMSYDAFVRAHILDQLDMNRSGWKMADIEPKDKVSLYAFDYSIPDFELITYADGGFVTSIDELVPYLMDNMRAYYGSPSTLLKPESSEELFTQQFNPDNSYGVYWVVGKKRIGHTGGDPGVTTAAFFNRATGTGIILFSNSSGDKVSDAFGKLFRQVDSFAERLNR